MYTRLHTGLCIPKHLIKAAIPLHYTQLVLNKDLLTQHRSAVKNQPPQVKEAHEALVAHLLVCGEHDDVAPKIKATGADC